MNVSMQARSINPAGINPEDLSQEVQDQLAVDNAENQEKLINFLKFYLIGLFALIVIQLGISLFTDISASVVSMTSTVITSSFTVFASLAGMVFQSIFGIIKPKK